jgi:hypothetical protein
MKLKEKEKNSFYINKKKAFRAKLLRKTDLEEAFNFAYQMTFGKGHHRENRSGGQESRTQIKIFKNTLQGKIAEIALYNYFLDNKIDCGKVDFSVSGKGIWDDADLTYKNTKLSVKSTAYFSNLLLLETKDWNDKGQYIPNISDSKLTDKYDYHILLRISPSANTLFKNSTDEDILKKEFNSITWTFDIAGCVSHKTIIYIIKENYILPQNSLLNGKIKIDSENYYIQSGDLKDIELLINILKK